MLQKVGYLALNKEVGGARMLLFFVFLGLLSLAQLALCGTEAGSERRAAGLEL